jgi:DNA-binding HxlR family transcriptional regulator
MYKRKTEKIIACPLEYGLDVFSGKWKSRLICVIYHNPKIRYNELKKQLPEITDPVLSLTLKDLCEDELIGRVQYDEIPPRVEYELTDKGLSVVPVLQHICRWSNDYSPENPRRDLPHCKNCHRLEKEK